MNRAELRQSLRARYGAARQKDIDLVADWSAESRKGDLSEACALLEMMMALPTGSDPKRSGRSWSDRPMGRIQAAAIRANVEEIRRELFGKTRVPFRTYAAAVRWIEKEVGTPPPHITLSFALGGPPYDRPARALVDGAVEKAHQHLFEAAERLPFACAVTVKVEPLELPYLSQIAPEPSFARRTLVDKAWRPGLRRVRVPRSSALARLALWVREIAERTAVPEHLLVAHVLSGTALVLPRAEWSTAEVPVTEFDWTAIDQATTSRERYAIQAQRIERTRVRLTISCLEDFTADDEKALFREIRSQAFPFRRKHPSPEDGVIRELVAEAGSPPRSKGVAAYWTALLPIWRRRVPKDRRSVTWKALRIRYERTIPKWAE